LREFVGHESGQVDSFLEDRRLGAGEVSETDLGAKRLEQSPRLGMDAVLQLRLMRRPPMVVWMWRVPRAR